MDKETQKLMSEGESWKAFVEGEMWQKAKKIIEDGVVATESIHSLEMKKPEDMVVEISGRKLATKLILEWITEVEGLANQYDFNKELKEEENKIIQHH